MVRGQFQFEPRANALAVRVLSPYRGIEDLPLPRTLIVLLVLVSQVRVQSEDVPRRDCKSSLCALVASGHLSDLRWPGFSAIQTQVRDFYEPTDYLFAWTQDGTPSEEARSIIQVLREAASNGLNPEDYDGSRWASRLAALRDSVSPSESDLARFDLAVTISVMRYISDLHLGRMNPGAFLTKFDLEPGQNDLAAFVRQGLVNSPNVAAAFSGVEPPYEGYRRTQSALRRYLVMASNYNAPSLPIPMKPVDPGADYPTLAQLADVLRRLGDLSEDAFVPPNATIYNGSLVDAVKHFQTRHGLEPDGRLGKATLAALNRPLSQRILQLELTLERWRWVPHSFPRPPIVVNIPEFELRALNDSYRTELEMKVVVGTAFRHPTPVFAGDMRYVIFRPYWNVPLSIQKAELVPKIAHDPSYLAKNGYEVVTTRDAVVTKDIVDDVLLEQLRSGQLRIRQVSGPDNSLGLVKFLFPNDHNVYLHATPATDLFSKTRRDFSHGCIRVEKPDQLAAWVLKDRPEWTPERILDAMNGAKTVQVTLDRPIPVLIVYATAVVLENGEVRFLEDIYGEDKQLARLLAEGYPYRR